MLTTIFGYYYNHPMMDTQDSGWGIFMMFFWFIVLILLVVGVVHLLKGNTNQVHHNVKPLDVAKERYAKGEIKKAEYEQIKKDLA